MGTYRLTEDNQLEPYQPSDLAAENVERDLEDWLERNSHVAIEGTQLLYIGRQVRTNLGHPLDLLAVDEQRRVIVIELKRERAPRDVVAQALEYAASVSPLTYDDLNAIAVEYFSERGWNWKSLAEAHRALYAGTDNPEAAEDLEGWNGEQIILIVAASISPEITSVARYLRTHDIDIRAVQFTYLKDSSGSRLVTTQMLVGDERLPREIRREATRSQYPPIPAIGQQTQEVIDSFKGERFRLADFYARFAEMFPETHEVIRSTYQKPQFNDRVFLSVQLNTAKEHGYIRELGEKVEVEGWPYPQPLFERAAKERGQE